MLMFRGTRMHPHLTDNRELQSFEEIKHRQQLHEKDDYENLTSKQAIDNSMSPEERILVRTMLVQNQLSKNRTVWKPQKLVLNKKVQEEIDKFEIFNKDLS